MAPLLADMAFLFSSGGVLMWPLLLCSALLWFSLGYRSLRLKRGSALGVRELLQRRSAAAGPPAEGVLTRALDTALSLRVRYSGDIGRYLDQELSPALEGMSRFRSLSRSITIVAPLIGLLGTVSGMVEMFESLSSQVFYSQAGGVANGISRALVTTQLGLVVAIPGMIVGRLLDRRERRIREDIEQVRDLLSDPQVPGAGR